MKFTTGYKFMFGTPDVDGGEGRQGIFNLKSYPVATLAIVEALRKDMSKKLT